jgi:hypothetical protein
LRASRTGATSESLSGRRAEKLTRHPFLKSEPIESYARRDTQQNHGDNPKAKREIHAFAVPAE